MFVWSTTQQESKSNGVKILAHAPAGFGKTVLCATAPAPMVISAESGLLSLAPENLVRMFGQNDPSISYNIPVAKISTMADLDDVYNWIMGSAEARQFQTVCLDSLTEIGETILANSKSKIKDNRQAYGDFAAEFIIRVKKFRDIQGKNVYMSAKQGDVKDELAGLTKYGPLMPSKSVSQGISYYFDEVFRLGIGNDAAGNSYRFIQTQPDIQYDAKDRSGALSMYEPPHLGHIIRKLSGAV